jgi:hypothetical protein
MRNAVSAYGRAASANCWVRRIFVIETTSIAFVICAMFLTDRIRLLMSREDCME